MVEPPAPGVVVCQRCGWLFVSPDPERIRRCADCKRREDDYQPTGGTLAADLQHYAQDSF